MAEWQASHDRLQPKFGFKHDMILELFSLFLQRLANIIIFFYTNSFSSFTQVFAGKVPFKNTIIITQLVNLRLIRSHINVVSQGGNYIYQWSHHRHRMSEKKTFKILVGMKEAEVTAPNWLQWKAMQTTGNNDINYEVRKLAHTSQKGKNLFFS